VPNNGKAKELVGFDPKTTLDQIIHNVAADHRPLRSADPVQWKVTMAAS
jgi:UDP-glucose 4-epimerase